MLQESRLKKVTKSTECYLSRQMTMTATQSELQATLASDSLSVVLEDPGSIIPSVNSPYCFSKVLCADVSPFTAIMSTHCAENALCHRHSSPSRLMLAENMGSTVAFPFPAPLPRIDTRGCDESTLGCTILRIECIFNTQTHHY